MKAWNWLLAGVLGVGALPLVVGEVRAAPSVEKGVCEKLQLDFVKNEKRLAYVEFHLSWLRDLIHELQKGNNYEDDGWVEDSNKKNSEILEEYAVQGDRITNLIIANNCIPPDHITSASTFREEVMEECDRFGGYPACVSQLYNGGL